ncbi:hypothetical protein TRFO_24713 [Tritrichomonas foetus]|uniref:Beige/BEACH domain containing protein n=1 Tax=Tritrichomonas foetus TaxID=1144522 RepID=A0A1J4KC74_9EUKA|nr:hypothetical protein TRFO_24713 [Tritrichomonas foetus]|eukprot:OHT07061.1 hypothetical protein TRFO_24713 [Tritrichomonas foetus]
MKSYLDGWMFTNKSDKSIIKLLGIRNDVGYFFPEKTNEIRSDPQFLKIPSFSIKNINIFSNAIYEGKSIKKSLKLINYSKPFCSNYIDKLIFQINKKSSISDLQIVSFLFECLSFIVFEPNKNKREIFINIFTIFNESTDSLFSAFFGEIFQEITELLLADSSIEFDLTLLNLIFEQIVMNHSIDQTMSSLILNILSKCILLRNNDLIESSLSVITMLFEDQRSVVNFNNSQFSHLISLLTEFINELKHNALLILAHCSQRAPDEITVQDCYKTLPNLIIVHLSNNKSVLFPINEIIIGGEIDDEEIPHSDEELISPSEDLILCDDSIINLYESTNIQSLTNQLSVFISLSSPKCISFLVDSVDKMRNLILESDHQIDLIIALTLTLPSLAVKTSIDILMQLYNASSIFSPSQNIFNKDRLNKKLNIIRSFIFQILAEIDSTLFVFLIEGVSNYPFLLTEYVMRLSYIYGNSFFKNPTILYSMLCSLNILQQMKNTKPKMQGQNIILSVLFSLLDDPDVALSCFSEESFCTSFMNLLLEPNMTENAISLFTKCVSRIDFLPDTMVNLISMILKTCATKSSDQQFKDIARQLVKSLISAMSHNISVGKSISPIFDNTLTFLTSQSIQDNETLEMTLMICALVTQSQKTIEVTNTRYNMVLDILQAVENNEPSDLTLMSLTNQMNASTNITLDQMFIIQAPMVIPIILAAFSQSKRINTIISLFIKLVTFSVKNIIMCNEGDLCYILLKALKDPFQYKGRLLTFAIDESTIDEIFKLVSIIISVRSSVKVNNSFCSLFHPDKNGTFGKNAEKSISVLHQLFSSYDHTIFQICTEKPVFQVHNIDGSVFNYSFAFCFNAKIDTNYLSQFPNGYFTFLRVADNNQHILEIIQQQDSFIARYDGNKMRTSAPLNFPLPANKWTFISVFFMKDVRENSTICYFKVGRQMSDDIIFINMAFDKIVNIDIGLTKKVIIPPSDISPVSMSQFALILPPYEDATFDNLVSNGFSDLNLFETVGFAYNTSNLIHKGHRREFNLQELMPVHLRPRDFQCLFKYCDKMPSLFVETALDTLFMATDFPHSGKSPPALSILSNKFSLDFPIFNFSRNYFNKRYSSIRMSEISVVLSYLLDSRYHGYPSIFSILLKAVEGSLNDDFRLEVLENFILNIWFWNSQNPVDVKKNMRLLYNFFIECKIPDVKCNLFTEYLIQSHFVKGNFLKYIEILPFQENEIESICSLILYLSSSLKEDSMKQEDTEKEILYYLRVLIVILSHQKNLVIPKTILISLAEIVPRNSSENVTKVLCELFCSINQDNEIKELIMASVSLNCNILNILKSSDIEFTPISLCIHAIRTNDIDCLLTVNEKFLNWQFWLTFTAVSLSSEVIVTKMIPMLNPGFVDNYCIILNYFEILRSIKKYSCIQYLQKIFMSSILDSSLNLKPQIILMTALCSFFSLFHKYKKSPTSKRLLQIDNPTISSNIKKRLNPTKIKDILENNHDFISNQPSEKDLNNDSDLNFESFSQLFPDNIENENKLHFWLSVNQKIDETILKRILKLLTLPHKEIESVPIVKMIIQFINEYLRTGKIPLISNDIFPLFSSNDNNIRNKFEIHMQHCWKLLREFLDYSKSKFDFTENFEQNVAVEMTRYEKLRTCQDRYSTLLFNPSRFLKFPFPEKSTKIKFYSSSTNILMMNFRSTSFDYLSQVNQSFFCQLVTLNKPIDATFHIKQNEFQLVTLHQVICIPFNDVKMVSLIRKNILEIFVEGCESYLLSLSPRNFQRFSIMSFQFPILKEREKAKNDIIKSFLDEEISVFDLIIALNIITGRSFNDSGYFPIFPIAADDTITFAETDVRGYAKEIEEWNKLIYQFPSTPIKPNTNTTKTTSIPMSNNESEVLSEKMRWDTFLEYSKKNQNCFSPFFYSVYDRFLEIFEDKTVDEMKEIVYSMKRRVENSSTVLQWIKRCFHIHNELAIEPKIRKTELTKINLSKKVVVSSFFENSQDTFVSLFDTGKIEILSIHESSIKKVKRFLEKFNNSNIHMIALKNYVMIYDSSRCIIYKISIHNYSNIEEIPYSTSVSDVLSVNDYLIFVIDRNIIVLIPCDTFPNNPRVLYTEVSEIICIAASHIFDVIVFATTDQNVKIISSKKEYSLLADIKLDDTCEKIIITQQNGFIVVKTKNEIITISLNGRILARSKCDLTFKSAIAAVSLQKDDFVYFIDEYRQLNNFEAFRPDEISTVIPNIPEVSSMKFNSQRNAIIMITQDGEILILPVCF